MRMLMVLMLLWKTMSFVGLASDPIEVCAGGRGEGGVRAARVAPVIDKGRAVTSVEILEVGQPILLLSQPILLLSTVLTHLRLNSVSTIHELDADAVLTPQLRKERRRVHRRRRQWLLLLPLQLLLLLQQLLLLQ